MFLYLQFWASLHRPTHKRIGLHILRQFISVLAAWKQIQNKHSTKCPPDLIWTRVCYWSLVTPIHLYVSCRKRYPFLGNFLEIQARLAQFSDVRILRIPTNFGSVIKIGPYWEILFCRKWDLFSGISCDKRTPKSGTSP